MKPNDSLSGENAGCSSGGVRSSRAYSILWERLRNQDRICGRFQRRMEFYKMGLRHGWYATAPKDYEKADAKRREIRIKLKFRADGKLFFL